MSHKTTELLDGVVINPETITTTEDFYSENKDMIVRALRYLFPQVKHWDDIAKAGHLFQYYNAFKGLDTRFTVKEYFKHTVITATPRSVLESGKESPEVNLPDIPTTPVDHPVEPTEPAEPVARGFKFRVASPDSAKSEERFEVNIIQPSSDWQVLDGHENVIASKTINTPDAVVITDTEELALVELKNLRNRTLDYTVKTSQAKAIKLESTLTAARDVEVVAFDTVIKGYNFDLPKVNLVVPLMLPKHIDDLSNMFSGSKLFNQDLTTWDTAHVTKMDGMFKGAESFNQDLSSWDVGLVDKEPVDFREQTPDWQLPKPQWNTGGENISNEPEWSIVDWDVSIEEEGDALEEVRYTLTTSTGVVTPTLPEFDFDTLDKGNLTTAYHTLKDGDEVRLEIPAPNAASPVLFVGLGGGVTMFNEGKHLYYPYSALVRDVTRATPMLLGFNVQNSQFTISSEGTISEPGQSIIYDYTPSEGELFYIDYKYHGNQIEININGVDTYIWSAEHATITIPLASGAITGEIGGVTRAKLTRITSDTPALIQPDSITGGVVVTPPTGGGGDGTGGDGGGVVEGPNPEVGTFKFSVTSPDVAVSDEPFKVVLNSSPKNWALYDETNQVIASATVSTTDVTIDDSYSSITLTLNNLRGTTRSYTLAAQVTKVLLVNDYNSERAVEVTAFGGPNISNYNFELNKASLTVPDTLPEHLTNLYNMFDGCTNFNQDLSGWDVSNVTMMERLFAGCSSFNQPLNTWNVSNVTDMKQMFVSADVFNQDLSAWDVSGVENMTQMFNAAGAFNQDISGWNVGKLGEMDGMFTLANSFNQDLSQWCMIGITTEPQGFEDIPTSWILPKPVWGTCPRGEITLA